MSNNLDNKKPIKPQDSQAVLFLKLLILLVIVTLPVAFMFLDLSRTFFMVNNGIAGLNIQANSNMSKGTVNEFNIQVPLPAKAADINSVPKEELDSLFPELKK
ncbi:MAG: hypothetical protein WC460_01585 [Patescibacteria group bacterium]